jgi:hypothetical protein
VPALAIFGGSFSFIVFAFERGRQVKSDADAKQHSILGQDDGGLGSN